MSEAANNQTQKSLAKVQWVMIVAFNEELGIGEERILRVLNRFPELLEEYGGWKDDGVADEKLAERVKQIMPKSFKRLYEE